MISNLLSKDQKKLIKYTKDTVIELDSSDLAESSSTDNDNFSDPATDRQRETPERHYSESIEQAIGYSIIKQVAIEEDIKAKMLRQLLKKPEKEKQSKIRQMVKDLVKDDALRDPEDQPMRADDTEMPKVAKFSRESKFSTGSKIWLLDPQNATSQNSSDFKTIDPYSEDIPQPMNVFQV